MYEMKSRVRYSEIDNTGHITLTGVINLLQDSATIHSHDLGYSAMDLSKADRAWFVTDYQIHIKRLPIMGEELRTQTYPYSVRGMMASRHFKIYAGDELVITANSIWIYMDIKKVKPVRITQEMADAYGCDDKPEDDFGPRKIALPEDMEKEFDFTVEKFHLDVNRHMNNGKYIEMIQDILPEKPLKKLRVEYKKQAVLGDKVSVFSKTKDNILFVLMKNEGDVMFTMEYIFDRDDVLL
ncbi:MAG: acyl-[acyl-carrier-protein] thioesterase [Lachnospiraceae bacterium]|nr:acyl-[acyl-carrier-protein] thioesterase [Lachnospiraceae bacterium]